MMGTKQELDLWELTGILIAIDMSIKSMKVEIKLVNDVLKFPMSALPSDITKEEIEKHKKHKLQCKKMIVEFKKLKTKIKKMKKGAK